MNSLILGLNLFAIILGSLVTTHEPTPKTASVVMGLMVSVAWMTAEHSAEPDTLIVKSPDENNDTTDF